jgi:hypothetical protein
VISLILAKDLSGRLEPGLLEHQCGFRPQRSCTDQIFTLRKLSELSVEWQQRLYVAFVDLRKAFDSIARPALWAILRARGVPEQLVGVIRDLHSDTTCRVRVNGRRSRQFSMEFGVQQGCPLASVLFNVFFDHVVREALAACPGAGVALRRRREMGADLQQPPPGMARHPPALLDMPVPLLMLADDLALLAATAEGLRRFLDAFDAACGRWGLVINAAKTELMLVAGAAALACEGCEQQQPEHCMLVCAGCQRGWHTTCLQPPLSAAPRGEWLCPGCVRAGGVLGDVWRPQLAVRGEPLAWVNKFKYLGSCFESTASLGADIARRTQLAAHAFRQLERPVLRQACVSLSTRISVYICMVMSVLLYGSESWALSAAQLEHLEVFHRCRLRMILGVRMSQHMSNATLHARSGAPPISLILARRQLRWVGHLGRMPDTRIAKQAMHSTMFAPGRSRRLGRPHRGLSHTYSELVSEHMSRQALRERTGTVFPRGTTWLTLCQDRAIYRSLCP